MTPHQLVDGGVCEAAALARLQLHKAVLITQRKHPFTMTQKTSYLFTIRDKLRNVGATCHTMRNTMMYYRCDNCNFTQNESEFNAVRRASERFDSGQSFTTCECPLCSCLAYPVVKGEVNTYVNNPMAEVKDEASLCVTEEHVKRILADTLDITINTDKSKGRDRLRDITLKLIGFPNGEQQFKQSLLGDVTVHCMAEYAMQDIIETSDTKRFTLYINENTNEEWVMPDASSTTLMGADKVNIGAIDQFEEHVIDRIQDVYSVVAIHVPVGFDGSSEDVMETLRNKTGFLACFHDIQTTSGLAVVPRDDIPEGCFLVTLSS